MTSNTETAIHKIKLLIEKYDSVKGTGKLRSYTEQDTKKDFIEVLFEILGWDMRDRNEVSSEEQISGKRADYGFYLNSRARFYLEAKKFSADLEDENFANQCVRYSWNKGVTWAVLTDFESIKVFCAQEIDKKLADKIFFEISYKEYISRFDQLWWLSKESFEKGVLDKEAEKVGKKMLKKSVSSLLYEDLNECREILTRELSEWNQDVPRDLLDEGVQKILDRLIFLRVAEDRAIEPDTLKTLLRDVKNRKSGTSIFKAMIEKFRELDDVYNSNLFSKHPFEEWESYEDGIEKVIEKLNGKKGYYEYDFKVMPSDVLGSVYENYLGYKLSATTSKNKNLFGKSDQKIVIHKDAKKRKEQGIYYTPAFIVDYIVRNSLKPVLDNCRSIAELGKIKVLDPACGSGSFLIKALEILNDKYIEFGRPGNEFTKLEIIANNIYGVDLDLQAVEIARLNLLVNSLDQRMKMPNLDKNIKNGNSLISGTDAELKNYFGNNFRDKKPFNWEEEFPEVFRQGGFDVIIGNPPYIKEFVNKSAFDGLHDNPYYQGKMDLWTMFACVAIDLLKGGGILGFIAPNNWITNAGASIMRDKVLKDGELKTFVDFGDYKVFEHAGIQTMVFIFEKKKPSRKYEVDYLRISNPAIEEVDLIGSLHKEKTKIEIEPEKLIGKNITFSTSESGPILSKVIKKGSYYLLDSELTQGVVPNPDVINSRNIDKISNSDIKKFDIKIYDGVFVIPKKYLNVSNSEKKYIKPLFDTEQIGRYQFDENNKKELISIPRNEEMSENSPIMQHLSKYRPIMEERRENLSGSIKYYNLHWPRNKKYFEKGPKIISVRKCKVPTFSYTEDESYVMLTFNVIKTDRINLKYLLALLNSRIICFWLKQKGKLQGDMFQIDTEPLQQIPICVGDNKQQKVIIDLADKMLFLNKELHELPENSEKWLSAKSEIEKTDRKIDEEVYKLYGLTSAEINIIEENAK